ncbi:hypothetical protein E2320_018016 [Naja naja]|nr:hypothetical protein E2320_018016 [Naja naja]
MAWPLGRRLPSPLLFPDAAAAAALYPMAAPPRPVSAQEKDGADSLVTQRVCREDELHAGEMREVEVAGYPVLLVREGLNIRALGGRCPHAGAALCKGYLAKGRLRCPWHGACFSTETGDIEEYPTLDCLPVFQVTVQEGQVHISARMKDLESSRRVKPMAQECQLDPQTVLLLGAGPAALTCAETLRQEGFSGRIIMATWENHLPYDRTKLTQDLGVPAESLYLRSQRFLDAHDIEVWKQSEVGGGWHELTSPWWFVSPPGQAAVLACRVLKLSRGKGSTVKGSLLHWGGNKPLGRSCPPHLMDLGSTQQHLGKDQHRHHGRNWSQCWTSPASFEFAAGLGPAWTGGGGGGGFTWAPAQPLGIQHGFHLAAGGVSGSCRQNGPLPGRGIPGDSNLLIATGSSPRKLQCPGCSLENVCMLLTPEDANRILALALGKTVVIVGASFIGMEVAASLLGKAAQLQVVEREELPYLLTLGGQVGTVAMQMLEAQGVRFHMKTEVAQMQGEDGKVTSVLLSNGSVLPADLVVVGIGVTPNTRFIQGSSIRLDRGGAVLVDLGADSLSLSCSGHVAALNMLHRQKPLHTVPFFWTKLQSKSIRYAGYGPGHTETVPKGELAQERFLLFYLRDGWVTAVASLDFDPLVAVVAETLYSGKRISKQEAESLMEGKELPKREPPPQ